MKFVWQVLNEPIEWQDGGVITLAVENRPALRDLVSDIRQQIAGEAGPLVLSEQNRILEFSKAVELLTDPFALPLSGKRLQTRILQYVMGESEDYAGEFHKLLMMMNDLAARIGLGLEYDITNTDLTGFDELIKLMGFHADTENTSFFEQTVDYLQMASGLLGKKLLIFYGLHTYLTRQEMKQLRSEAAYRKLCVLLLEGVQPPAEDTGSLIVVDEDLCIF